jgi:TRAP-type C4-dicarboxylate transport system permease small subunit
MKASTLISWFDALMRGFCTLFAVSFGILTLLVCVDIVTRRAGIASMSWLVEVIEYVMYAGTFLAAPWVLRQGEHVRVDLILTSIPKDAAIRLQQFVDALGLLISVIMVYYGAALVLDAYKTNSIQFKNIAVHEWILMLPIAIGSALLAIEFCLRLLRVRGAVEQTKFDLEVPGA